MPSCPMVRNPRGFEFRRECCKGIPQKIDRQEPTRHEMSTNENVPLPNSACMIDASESRGSLSLMGYSTCSTTHRYSSRSRLLTDLSRADHNVDTSVRSLWWFHQHPAVDKLLTSLLPSLEPKRVARKKGFIHGVHHKHPGIDLRESNKSIPQQIGNLVF